MSDGFLLVFLPLGMLLGAIITFCLMNRPRVPWNEIRTRTLMLNDHKIQVYFDGTLYVDDKRIGQANKIDYVRIVDGKVEAMYP